MFHHCRRICATSAVQFLCRFRLHLLHRPFFFPFLVFSPRRLEISSMKSTPCRHRIVSLDLADVTLISPFVIVGLSVNCLILVRSFAARDWAIYRIVRIRLCSSYFRINVIIRFGIFSSISQVSRACERVLLAGSDAPPPWIHAQNELQPRLLLHGWIFVINHSLHAPFYSMNLLPFSM